MSIFRAYDIRGIYGTELTDELAHKLGLAYCTMLREELKSKKKISAVVGSDMRLSSPALKKSLVKGLVDGGFDVADIGLASTPTFYFAVAHYGYDGGILVSASHNPKEYNGFKLVRKKAIPISQDTGIFKLRDLVSGGNLKKSRQKGRVTTRKDVLSAQVSHDLQYGNADKIKPLKIVIDTANAMGSLYFDELCRHLPCRITRINWELDGRFPAHEANPYKFENICELCEQVKKEKADLGIATDGDADRIFFVDEKGIPVEPGIVRAILSKIFLRDHPGAKIAYDVRPGKITEDTILANGGIPVVTRVGHSLIKEQSIREGVYFAGESSGHFFLRVQDGFYEVPMIVTLRILQELSDTNTPFSNYLRPYQKYFHSGEINFTVKDASATIAEVKENYGDAKLSELDGLTVEYKDWWFNLRASNTEPLVRLNLEARSREIMERKKEELRKILSS